MHSKYSRCWNLKEAQETQETQALQTRYSTLQDCMPITPKELAFLSTDAVMWDPPTIWSIYFHS